jgi:filamentous hemagglutinin family protein
MVQARIRDRLKSGTGLGLLSLLIASASSASVLPTNGHFAVGQGEIGKSAQSLTIRQSSTTGIIDWGTFSIGRRDIVRLDNGTGATLNRVTGGDLSIVAGSLHATGSLYLINSQGVIVSGNGRVVTGGAFVASSGSLSGDAFNAGDRRFFNAKAAVINHGSIISGGAAQFVGGSAVNTGTIRAAAIKLHADASEARDSGAIHATGNAHRDAHILLIAENGRTKITGSLSARSRDGLGGIIETSGRNVSIAGRINAGSCGKWLLDPENLTVTKSAAATIDNSLKKGTNVTLKTTKISASGPGTHSKGPGDIVIGSDLAWTTNAKLELDAYHSVEINASIKVGGSGSLSISTANGGDLSFSRGNVAFTDVVSGTTKGNLSMNGKSYTLANSVSQLASDIASDVSGRYALANSYNASGDGVYTSSPIGGLSGTIEGLGNVIKNLKVESPTVGFSSSFINNSSGIIRDLGLVDATVTGKGSASNGGPVGVLVANNNGSIIDCYTTGQASDGKMSDIGGLVARNYGSIVDSYAETSVSGGDGSNVGGLVGVNNGGTIIGSYATGSVVGGNYAVPYATYYPVSSNAGGLVGYSTGNVESSYATGNVTGGYLENVGGLIGATLDGNVEQSYTTGNATGGNGAAVGGLVGGNYTNSISGSFASGTVAGGSNSYTGGLVGFNNGGEINQSHAGGEVSGATNAWIGGLVGYTDNPGATITDSFATGEVDVSAKVYGVDAGGLVGLAGEPSTITDSYATGAVTTSKYANAGGLVGFNDGTISKSFARGSVSAGLTSNVGGFVGENYDNIGITQSYAAGAAVGGDYANVGGFVGLDDVGTDAEEDSGTIKNAYALGNATGGKIAYVGGFAGVIFNATTIADTYSTGSVTGGRGAYVGGYVGVDYSSGVIVDSYWDTTTSGVSSSSGGAGNLANDGGIAGLSTSQLQSGPPAGFTNSIWATSSTVNGGFPYLKALLSSY